MGKSAVVIETEEDEVRGVNTRAQLAETEAVLQQRLRRAAMDAGVTINRPPRDGKMAFVRSPDNISVELLQKGDALPKAEPWASMPNTGVW